MKRQRDAAAVLHEIVADPDASKLNWRQALVLLAIYDIRAIRGAIPTTIGDLSSIANIDRSVVSRSAMRLEELGLIGRRRGSEDDERATVISPTEAGADLHARLKAILAGT